MRLEPLSEPDVWRGQIAWETRGTNWQPWRLPPELIETAHAPELESKAKMGAGIRAEFHTDAATLELFIKASTDEVTPIDLVVNGELSCREPLSLGDTTVRFELPRGDNALELWLPQAGEIEIGAIVLEGATFASPTPRHATRWLTYGSSITQCRTAPGPTETWPAIVAYENGWDLCCLGFGGQCHLDPICAQTVASTPSDLISMCLGINVYGHASLGVRTLAGQVSAFISTVRAAQPSVPIVVFSPISSPSREQTTNAVSLTLAQVRDEVEHAVVTLQQRGDDRLHLVSGPSIIGLDEAHLLADGLHPSPEGYRAMGQRIAPILQKIYRQA